MSNPTHPDAPEPGAASEPRPDGPGAAELALLLLRAGHGDEVSLAVLYDATSSRTFGLAVSVLGDPAEAEEVLLEAYQEIWRSSARLDTTAGGPMAWILMIVHRTAVARVRARAVRRTRSPSPQDVRRVRHALAGLTPRQRAALSLAYFEGRTHTEISTLLGFGPGMALVRIRESLTRLGQVRGWDESGTPASVPKTPDD